VNAVGALDRLGLGRSVAVGPAPSGDQAQTGRAFGYKWGRLDSYGSPAMEAFTREWSLRKYCGSDPAVLDTWLAGGRKIILDAGCGSGYTALAFLGDRLREHDYLGVDISDAVAGARMSFRERGLPGDFLQHDMTTLPIPDASVDLILAEGTLHHTNDTGAAMTALAAKLVPGGRFLAYIYARKGPLREYADDLVRREISGLTDEEAWERLKPLTRLGIALGQLGVLVDVPEDIQFLGIKAGRITVQELMYYAVVKAFYRPDWSFDEMHHVNFDWYRPANARRHTEEEVRGFVEAAGLTLERLYAEPSGYSVVATSPSEAIT
jgi:arsenite methyltransferase